MTNTLPEQLDDHSTGVLDLLLLWLDAGHETLLEEELQPLITWLISVPDETKLDWCLSQTLIAYFDCLVELSHWVTNDYEPEHGTSQREWLGSIERVSKCVPRGSADWYQTASTLCHRQDDFLNATLGQAIETLPEYFGLPAEVHQLITLVRRTSQKKYEHWPVPPADGRSVLTTDYVHRGSDKSLHVLLEKLIKILLGWDEETLDDVARRSIAANASSIEYDVDAVLIASDNIVEVASEFIDGWPVERERLQRPLASLKRFVANTSDNSIATVASTEKLLNQINEKLKVDSTDLCETKAQQNAPPDSLINPELLDVDKKLTALVDSIQSRNFSVESRFLSTLTNLIRKTISEREERTDGILDLLVELNEDLSGTAEHETELLYLRNQLHGILVENLNFRVLNDDNLVGQSLDGVRDWVTIYRSYDSTSLPANHIISVRCPGYLVRSSNGASNLVRPAEVNVSR